MFRLNINIKKCQSFAKSSAKCSWCGDVIIWKHWEKKCHVSDVRHFFVLLCLELDLGTTWAKITAFVNLSHLWQSTHVWPAGVMLTYAVDIRKTPRYPSVEGHLCLNRRASHFGSYSTMLSKLFKHEGVKQALNATLNTCLGIRT